MSAEVSIQSLFARLRLDHLNVYLPDRGWRDAPEPRADRVRYELPDENNAEDDAPFVLLLPLTDKAPEHHTLLQRAVYNLSCIENRQPAEVLRDLLAIDLSQRGPKAASGATPHARGSGSVSPVRIKLRNSDSSPLTIRVAGRNSENHLLPEEAIELLCHPSDEESLEICFQDSLIEVRP